MVVWVVGDDSQGGWTQPKANSPQPLLSLSSPTEERERERERESLVYTIFFSHSTPQCKQQNDKVLGAVAIFLVFTYILIVYVTTVLYHSPNMSPQQASVQLVHW